MSRKQIKATPITTVKHGTKAGSKKIKTGVKQRVFTPQEMFKVDVKAALKAWDKPLSLWKKPLIRKEGAWTI